MRTEEKTKWCNQTKFYRLNAVSTNGCSHSIQWTRKIEKKSTLSENYTHCLCYPFRWIDEYVYDEIGTLITCSWMKISKKTFNKRNNNRKETRRTDDRKWLSEIFLRFITLSHRFLRYVNKFVRNFRSLWSRTLCVTKMERMSTFSVKIFFEFHIFNEWAWFQCK